MLFLNATQYGVNAIVAPTLFSYSRKNKPYHVCNWPFRKICKQPSELLTEIICCLDRYSSEGESINARLDALTVQSPSKYLTFIIHNAGVLANLSNPALRQVRFPVWPDS